MAGCAAKKDGHDISELKGNLAVAGFSQPEHEWELLGGYYSLEDKSEIDPKILAELNGILAQELDQHEIDYDLGPSQVRQCREYVLYKKDTKSLKAQKFWSRIGDCLSADYLLIPQIYQWRERQGGEYGVQGPAKVVFDLILLDVNQNRVVRTFRFDKEQKALTENILNIFKFFKRKGRWITAEKLAREGIVQGLEELGL